jgi:hypothetical protein
LREWVRVYRRAYAAPIPIETAVPVPVTSTTPVTRTDGATGRFLPTVAEWRDTGIPLLVFVVFGALAGAMGVVATKRVRVLRKRE